MDMYSSAYFPESQNSQLCSFRRFQLAQHRCPNSTLSPDFAIAKILFYDSTPAIWIFVQKDISFLIHVAPSLPGFKFLFYELLKQDSDNHNIKRGYAAALLILTLRSTRIRGKLYDQTFMQGC